VDVNDDAAGDYQDCVLLILTYKV